MLSGCQTDTTAANNSTEPANTPTGTLTGLLFNARSIVNKLDVLPLLIDHYNPKLILVTESWLNSCTPDSIFGLQRNFSLFRKDRTDQSGGGVCVFVANDLIATVIELPPELAHLELLCLDLLVCEAKYRVVCCYRPPYYDMHAQNYVIDLIKCLEALINVEHTVLIAGDLNLPNVDWESFSAPRDKIQHPISNFMQAEGFIQYVNQPTRDDRILDVLLCNDSLMISDCSVGPPVGRSDHNTVCFDMCKRVQIP